MPRNQGTSRKGKPKKNDRAAGMGRALQKASRPSHGGHMKNNKQGGMDVKGGVAAPSSASLSAPMANSEKNMSLLELDHLDDFLGQAEMLGREFASEKARYVVLDNHGSAYDPHERKVQWSDEAKPETQFTFEELSVPRRPAWNEDTTPAELDRMENESFLAWRRGIAAKEEEIFSNNGPSDQHAYLSKTVTPYEKNIHVWKQLWRVLERSSCVVGVIDGRNPNFYISDDLKKYAQELGKPMLLVVNKGDYLSTEQRSVWTKYLDERNWEHVFFSAHREQAKLDKAAQDKPEDSDDEENDKEQFAESEPVDENDAARLLTREELTEAMMEFAKKHGCEPNPRYDNRLQFGTVGFPNVGKSSVINVLMGNTKHTHGVTRVGVAAQPGKTKHFQTLLLPERDDMMLCDCPGLVFPSFVSNTADLIAAGVYPIAQMRDHWPVVELICQRIPREIINASYGIKLPVPSAQEMQEKGWEKAPPPTADEFLTTYCVARNMLATASGVPDYTRASKVVIKDYVSGKLLYCHPPPNIDDKVAFHAETVKTAFANTAKLRKKLAANQPHSQEQSQQKEGEEEKEAMDKEAEFDDNLLDILGDSGPANNTGGKRGKAHKTKKKWGKKGRKLRDTDPYGCHKTADELMLSGGHVAGVSVNAGKYSKSGYTRPTSYGGARAAN